MASKRDEERAERQKRVLDVASVMFADDGYDMVSLETLARGVDLSPRYLQQLYRGRSGILFSLLERHLERLFDAVKQPEDWPGDATDRLRAMAVALVECIGAHERDHKLLGDTAVFLPRPLRDDVTLRLRWLNHGFERALSGALPGLDKTPERAPMIATTLVSLLSGHGAWWSWDSPLARRDYAEAAVDMVLSGRLLG